jgi:hypothetical protein
VDERTIHRAVVLPALALLVLSAAAGPTLVKSSCQVALAGPRARAPSRRSVPTLDARTAIHGGSHPTARRPLFTAKARRARRSAKIGPSTGAGSLASALELRPPSRRPTPCPRSREPSEPTRRGSDPSWARSSRCLRVLRAFAVKPRASRPVVSGRVGMTDADRRGGEVGASDKRAPRVEPGGAARNPLLLLLPVLLLLVPGHLAYRNRTPHDRGGAGFEGAGTLRARPFRGGGACPPT